MPSLASALDPAKSVFGSSIQAADLYTSGLLDVWGGCYCLPVGTVPEAKSQQKLRNLM